MKAADAALWAELLEEDPEAHQVLMELAVALMATTRSDRPPLPGPDSSLDVLRAFTAYLLGDPAQDAR